MEQKYDLYVKTIHSKVNAFVLERQRPRVISRQYMMQEIGYNPRTRTIKEDYDRILVQDAKIITKHMQKLGYKVKGSGHPRYELD